MPWKTAPALGHIKGFVTAATNRHALDGATVWLNGPVSRTLQTDATGFFGAVDLPPGTYVLMASLGGLEPQTDQLEVTAGAVSTQSFALDAPARADSSNNVSVSRSADPDGEVSSRGIR
jgi:hypothetical protein